MADFPPNSPRPPMTDASRRTNPNQTSRLAMRTRTFSASSMTECLQMAKQELGLDAMIVSKRTFRRGAVFGRWGGKPMVEVTFGTYRAPAPPLAAVLPPAAPVPDLQKSDKQHSDMQHSDMQHSDMQQLEARVASLADSVQNLIGTGQAKAQNGAFVSSPIEAKGAPPVPETEEATPAPKPTLGQRILRRAPESEPDVPAARYGALLGLLQDAEVAAPLARILLAELPDGLAAGEAQSEMRTRISQRLLVAHHLQAPAGGEMRVMAFVGTTGVGKTTTVAKLAAQFALLERRRVGIVTLDTNRIAAAQQLQTYGQILGVPVQVARDKAELRGHLDAFRAQGTEIVLLDTAGRSPNDMVPMGEAGQLLADMGPVQKFLTVPATVAGREFENIVARFQSLMTPDALVLTKLDEASDSTCFGRLLTMQAKFSLPLAYVTTGQRVPDDLMLPDSHAIAARILTGAAL